MAQCPSCRAEVGTSKTGRLLDVAVYPNGAKYPRGDHAPTCAATLAQRASNLDHEHEQYTSTLASFDEHDVGPQFDRVKDMLKQKIAENRQVRAAIPKPYGS